MLDRTSEVATDRSLTGSRRGTLGRWVVACAIGILVSAGTAGAVQQVQDLLGCCVCRGTLNGQPNSSKSCESAMSVVACETKCRNSGASSLVYGNGQSCATGCAGLATQQLSK
ncbi:MAG: hypothetical protein ACRERC_26240 [Candidatus Binatia bacterium]